MKNRFYYSYSQDCISRKLRNSEDRERHNYVLVGDKWVEYSEWCSMENSKCNWEDAVLVFETDEEPQIKLFYKKPTVNKYEKQIFELECENYKKDQRIKVLERALELILEKDNYKCKTCSLNGTFPYCECECVKGNLDFLIMQAEKELKDVKD